MISIKEEKVIKDNKNGFPLKIIQDKSAKDITSNEITSNKDKLWFE